MYDSEKHMVLYLAKANQCKIINISKAKLIIEHIETNKERVDCYTLLSGQRGGYVTQSSEMPNFFPPTKFSFLW